MKIVKKDIPEMRPGRLRVVFLLDESGSMTQWRKNVVDTFNEYIQKVSKESDPLVSLYTFRDDVLTQHYRDIPSSHVSPMTMMDYQPGGATPLYDAVGTVLFRAPPTSRELMHFIVHTDGQENASREYQLGTLNDMIREREERGVQFTWLGEGRDGWLQISQMAGGQRYYFTSQARGMSMGAVASASAYYAETGVVSNATMNFTGGELSDAEVKDLEEGGKDGPRRPITTTTVRSAS